MFISKKALSLCICLKLNLSNQFLELKVIICWLNCRKDSEGELHCAQLDIKLSKLRFCEGKAFSCLNLSNFLSFWSWLVSHSHLLSRCLSGFVWFFLKIAFADIRLTSSAISNSIPLVRVVVVLQPFRSENPSDVLFMSCRK